jgi:hypothetical protein
VAWLRRTAGCTGTPTVAGRLLASVVKSLVESAHGSGVIVGGLGPAPPRQSADDQPVTPPVIRGEELLT